MVKHILVILALIATMAQNVASQTSFTLIPPRNVIEGNKFNLTFRLKNGETNIKAPQLDGCTLMYGPTTSMMSNYSWTNGKEERSTTVDYSFIYRADKSGTVTIPEVTVTVGKTSYTSKSATFKILPPDQSSSGQPQGNDVQSSAPAVNANDVLIRILLNKSHAFEQEAILCTIKLYTKHSISSFLPTVQPAFDGFLIEEVPVSPTLNEVEHYNGQNYMTAILKQCIIYPQKSGKLTINSGKYDVTVVQYERVGGFWGGNRQIERQIKTSSNSASINISPLPQPQPAGFNGAVGHFTIDSKLRTSVFRTNEAASLVYTIKGTGNIKYLKEPAIDFPSEFEQYQPQTDINTHVSGANVTGTQTIDYTFVPQSVGKFTIGADKFVYFNPDSKEYVTLTTPSYDISVSQGVTSTSSAVVANKQTIATKNTDILHIKLGNLNLAKNHTFIYNSWWYWPLYIILTVALIVIVWLYGKRMRRNADIQGRRLAKAGKVARKRLKLAADFMKRHDNDHFYEEILRALWGYLGDKLQLPASQLTRDNIAQELTKYGASQQLIDRFLGIIDDCEMARYSPDKSDARNEELYESAVKAMDGLENTRR
ncbi:MAG: BatD family protein [Muribaculum sp.]|nr:BatD family protein [Muribaculaceae bacterium]MCM1080346.1 BatD family protein [Muribaculum sp.]